MDKYFKSVNLRQGEAYYDERSDVSIGIHRIEHVYEIAKAVINLPEQERKNLNVDIKAGSLWKYINGSKKYVLHIATFRNTEKEPPFFTIEIREVE